MFLNPPSSISCRKGDKKSNQRLEKRWRINQDARVQDEQVCKRQ